MEIETHDILAALGHPHRLDLFRLLMRRYPDRVPAGELAASLGIKASTMSTYLAALQRVGLVTQERAGTSLLYSIDMANVRQVFGYLFADCCRGRPDLCLPFDTGPVPMPVPTKDRKYNVLFICTGNSARSIFAETLLRDLAGDRFEACSAGTQPRSELNPQAVALLEAKGHDVSGLRAKHVSEFQGEGAPVLDFVFTVCDRAANEDCPPWPGQPISAHWGQPDPVKATGTEAERKLAFQQAYGALRNRIALFTALPLDSLDRLSLQARVDEIAHLKEESA